MQETQYTSDSEEVNSISKVVIFYYGPYIGEKEIHMKMCGEMSSVIVCFSNIEKFV